MCLSYMGTWSLGDDISRVVFVLHVFVYYPLIITSYVDTYLQDFLVILKCVFGIIRLNSPITH